MVNTYDTDDGFKVVWYYNGVKHVEIFDKKYEQMACYQQILIIENGLNNRG